MANDALERLNARLGGKNNAKTGSAGQKDSGAKGENEGAVQTIDNPGEAFGAQARKRKAADKKEDKKEDRRGWPKGKPRGPKTGRAGTAAKENKTLIEGFASTLYGVHFFAAKAFDAREFELSEDEAEKVAVAIQRVSDQYGKVIDPKTEAWIGLIGILGSCYAPKIMVYNARKAAERKEENPERRQAQPAQSGPAKPEPVIVQPASTKKTAKDDKDPKNPSEFYGGLNLSPGEGPVQ